MSDLPIEVTNHFDKAREILNLQIPDSNFYGPGAALLVLPFLWLSSKAFLIICIYFVLGAISYFKLCNEIKSRNGRILALSGLPLNFYLIWLVNSSQDTVFEFFLLATSCLMLVKRRYLWFHLFATLLVLTRAGYWVFLLGTCATFLVLHLKRRTKIQISNIIALPIFILISLFNFSNYGSPSPALEGGLTAYFSYTKYHYLSLPKMDMDVFLSGKNGAFSEGIGPRIPLGSTEAEVDKIFRSAAIQSIKENPKETVLGWMQKADSYIFDVQKVPHLPGSFVLDEKNMTIQVGDQRLSWILVLGNLAFEIYRSLWLVGAVLFIGLLSWARTRKLFDLSGRLSLLPLLLPWAVGIIPGILVYTETRFKIVSEVILVPLLIQTYCKVSSKIKETQFN